jgi:hypothetical protein
MLSHPHFYHNLTRKAVILFGRMFDDIQVIRKNDQTGKEVSRFQVPIIYAPKEKMVTRVLSDPDLQRQLGVILPRMSFEVTGITYDSTRQQNTLLRASKSNTHNHVTSTYMGSPYDITFALYVYARNIDDGTQIVEQILPFFNPDFTVNTNLIPELHMLKDVPLILNSVTNQIEYEGDYESVRYVYWTLTFTMKTYYYGTISYPKIIRTVYANTYNDLSFSNGYITKMNLADASGTFKYSDTVYQGDNYKTATAFGIVMNHNSDGDRLMLGATQGNFVVNNTIHAVSSNATGRIESFDTTPLRLSSIKITPDPSTAEPGDDYGYTIDVTEWPET